MKGRGALRLVGVAVLAVGALPGAAEAQQVSVAYQAQSWREEELRRLHGGMVRVEWSNGLELSFDLGGASWDETGSTCAGLIDPSTCQIQPLDVESLTFGLALGYARLGWSVPGGELSMVPSTAIARAGVQKRGQVTGGMLEDSQTTFELGLAARYRTRPLGWVRLFGEVRGAAGTGSPVYCADCYDPLMGGTRRVSVAVGVTAGR